MSHHNSNRNAGFTIIEVLIVLAIAGLIMLIVFLAVPALNRNSRNTSIKNDVQNVLGGTAEFQNANNGRMPTDVGGTGQVVYSGPTGSNETRINIQGSTSVSRMTSAVPTTGDGPDPGTINIYLGRRCDGTVSARAVAAVFSIETTNNPRTRQCQES